MTIFGSILRLSTSTVEGAQNTNTGDLTKYDDFEYFLATNYKQTTLNIILPALK